MMSELNDMPVVTSEQINRFRDAALKLQEENEQLKKAIHYQECWDATAYPTFESALIECGCNDSCCIHEECSSTNYAEAM